MLAEDLVTGPLKCPMVAVLVIFYAFLPLTASGAEVLGKKPRHVWGGPSSVPNEQAITKRIWVPGIDDGYVPQGVTWADGTIYLSSYRSTDPKIDKGPCRIYKVDAESGETLGQFDLPEDCGHAGGLAYIGNGILVAADTRRLYKIDAASAFAGQGASTAVIASVRLGGQVKGSFVDFDGASLVVGSYEKDAARAKAHFLPLSIFDTPGGKTVDEGVAVRTIPIPVEAQGAAFDKEGNLWISASSGKFGALYKLDARTGRPLSSYEMVIGIEDLAFDEESRLWSVSEAGSIRWQKWSKTYPLLFRIDLDKLLMRP
jgi:outer membrane protein assembly factor BamB